MQFSLTVFIGQITNSNENVVPRVFNGLVFNSFIRTGSLVFCSVAGPSLAEKSQWVAQSSPPKFKSHLDIFSVFYQK